MLQAGVQDMRTTILVRLKAAKSGKSDTNSQYSRCKDSMCSLRLSVQIMGRCSSTFGTGCSEVPRLSALSNGALSNGVFEEVRRFLETF